MAPRPLLSASLILALAFAMVSLGCIRSAELMEATTPVPVPAKVGTRVSAEVCMFSLFGVIPFGRAPLVEAKARALRRARSDALVDVAIEDDWIFVVVGTIACTRVSGIGADAEMPAAIALHEPTKHTTPPKRPLIVGDANTLQTDSPDSSEWSALARETLPSWIGSQVVVVLKDSRQSAGELVEILDDALVLRTTEGRSVMHQFDTCKMIAR